MQSNLTCTRFEVAANKNHTIFSGRARDTGKLKKQGNFWLPRRRKDLRRWLTSSSRVNMMTNYHRLVRFQPWTSSLKISLLSFMNKALKIQPSIYWGRLPYPTPPGALCSMNCIYFSTFLYDAHVNFLIRQKTRFYVFFVSLTLQTKVYFPI